MKEVAFGPMPPSPNRNYGALGETWAASHKRIVWDRAFSAKPPVGRPHDESGEGGSSSRELFYADWTRNQIAF